MSISTTPLRDRIEAYIRTHAPTRGNRRFMRAKLHTKYAAELEAEARATRPVKLLCGAKTRRGTACIRKARANGRCPNHGGLSTGPKSEAGRQRIAEAQRRRWEIWRTNKTQTEVVESQLIENPGRSH